MMSSSNLELLELDNGPHWQKQYTSQLTTLSEQWLQKGLFWTANSCISTIDNIINLKTYAHQTGSFYSAALVAPISPHWLGWYLATIADTICDLLFIFTSDLIRGQGGGILLLNDLVKKCETNQNVTTILLEVRPSNTSAIGLYHRFGFELQSRRKGYYQNGEDALVYKLSCK